MKIVTVVGARPQFVKAAMLSEALRVLPGVEEVIVHTGQHYDENMSDIFFRELAIPRPDYQLGVGSGSHGVQTGRMLIAVEEVLSQESPDWVVVYGDTNSTLAGALAAVKLHLQIVHVEAGLRSFNRSMPEEVNRVLTDHSSDLLLAPTAGAVQNLLNEGISHRRIEQVGDIMFDAALHFGELAEAESSILETLKLTPREYVLATIHRAETTDDATRLTVAINGLSELATEMPVVFPVHPRTKDLIQQHGLLETAPPDFHVLNPVGYIDMLMLEKNARMIVTDSGGIQKEALFHRVPCVTLRHETEWVESVELGWNRLAPPISTQAVMAAFRSALSAPPGQDDMPYGDGGTAEAIAELLRLRGETG